MAFDRFPSELMLRVVEHSRNDVKVLRRLALASPVFRSQSLRHLFDRVTLSSAYSHHRWIQFVENSPDIAIPHLKILIIESGRYEFATDSSGQLWGDITPHTPQRILDLQPPEISLPNPPINNITTLIWSPLQSPNPHNLTTIAHIVSSLESARNLHVIKARFTSVQQFQWFLSHSGPITFLELHRVALDDEGTGQVQVDDGVDYDLTHLKELRVNSEISIDWVVHHILSTPTALTALSIESPSFLSLHAFRMLLEVVAPSLRSLVIATATISLTDLLRISITGLSEPRSLPQLQDLTIVVPFFDARLDAEVEHSWCTLFVDQFPQASALSCITLMLDVGNVTRLEQLINAPEDKWDKFLRLLLGKIPTSFPHVAQINIHLILDERHTDQEIQGLESMILKSSSSESVQLRVQWETIMDPGRYGHHLPHAMSPMVALALRSRRELPQFE
ncbi:hypothetical protein E1B28_007109 [Marasmius oreades]|uniref:Uncharacterized protein n=1 Tax=Marasmius oreades TaxID=181124 RepID=A0A9P7S0Y8_9AGAR|nr:uncharacterized protein E1B28_007109 [Marasmius oreades]KAG7093429.1 hypothetical protein E1B28_007109 [Marasmius oreades]